MAIKGYGGLISFNGLTIKIESWSLKPGTPRDKLPTNLAELPEYVSFFDTFPMKLAKLAGTSESRDDKLARVFQEIEQKNRTVR